MYNKILKITLLEFNWFSRLQVRVLTLIINDSFSPTILSIRSLQYVCKPTWLIHVCDVSRVWSACSPTKCRTSSAPIRRSAKRRRTLLHPGVANDCSAAYSTRAACLRCLASTLPRSTANVNTCTLGRWRSLSEDLLLSHEWEGKGLTRLLGNKFSF